MLNEITTRITARVEQMFLNSCEEGTGVALEGI
jgi:hypothetical protein